MYLARSSTGRAEALYETHYIPTPSVVVRRARTQRHRRAPSRAIIISGDVPDPADRPTGCSFHPRCPVATDLCTTEKPDFVELRPVASCLSSSRNLEAVAPIT